MITDRGNENDVIRFNAVQEVMSTTSACSRSNISREYNNSYNFKSATRLKPVSYFPDQEWIS